MSRRAEHVRSSRLNLIMATVFTVVYFYAPVVLLMTARNVSVEGHVVSAEVFGRKIRPDCNFVKDSEVGWEKVSGIWYELEDFAYLGDKTPGSTRAPGRQYFGVWQWSHVSEDATSLKVTNLHDCGFSKLTVNGPFKIR